MRGHQVGIVAASIGLAVSTGLAVYSYSAPVAYGVSEQSASVSSGAGILGMIVSAVTGVLAVLKGNGTLIDQGKQIISDIAGGQIPQTAQNITAEVALVTLAGICVKNSDTDNLTKVGELAKGMLVAKK